MSTWNDITGLSGNYTSEEITLSPEGAVETATMTWVESTPTLSSVLMYTSYSSNGTNFSDWVLQTNGESIAALGKYVKKLKYKVVLNRNDVLINPTVSNIVIDINKDIKYIHLLNGSTLTYDTSVKFLTTSTNVFYLKLPVGFSGEFVNYDNTFKVGYNGTKFYYENGSRITAGLPRSLPSGFFKVSIQPNKVMIFGTDYTEILQ